MMGPYDRYEWSDGAPINGPYILIGAPMSLHLYLMTGPTLWAHMFVFANYEVSWKVGTCWSLNDDDVLFGKGISFERAYPHIPLPKQELEALGRSLPDILANPWEQ